MADRRISLAQVERRCASGGRISSAVGVRGDRLGDYVMKSALGVSWASGLIPSFGCQRDERSRARAEAKRTPAQNPSFVFRWWSRVGGPVSSSLTSVNGRTPRKFSSLLLPRLLSRSYSVDDALEGFFSTHNQHHRRAVA